MAEARSTLFIRNLPSQLTTDEKKDLLLHFGANRVNVMEKKGPLKNSAFANFLNEEKSKQALNQLHQLEVLGSTLVVVYAKSCHQRYFPSIIDDIRNSEQTKKIKDKQETKEVILPVESAYAKWGLNYPANPRLHYRYPLPSVSVLTNIANAMASYPKFYNQVLHLMNKMNLPAPFGAVTPTPPIQADMAEIYEPDILETEEMDVSSTEESEIESPNEDRPAQRPSIKRPVRKLVKRMWKKPRLSQETSAPKLSITPAMKTSEVFDQSQQLQQKKIQFKISEAVVDGATGMPANTSNDGSLIALEETQPGSFGKIEPTEKPKQETENERDGKEKSFKDYVSAEELRKGRLSSKEMKELSVFKKYCPGEPSSRLYIKNLSKQTTEDDLWKIYGYYVKWKSEEEKYMFDIRLMQEGRMKGQAFVTFPSEEVAKLALEETNGFVVNNKPMVVQFARSAKQKDGEKK